MSGCEISERTVDGVRHVVLENERLYVSALPDKGGDIYEFVHKPSGLDVLWKSPWGVNVPGRGFSTATDSQVAWMENYEGGWQEIFPSGGGPCEYQGVEMSFHGEASTLAWDVEVKETSEECVSVVFLVALRRTPFVLRRKMKLRRDDPRLYISEKVTNRSDEELDYMWGHHPVFGEPFLDEGVILDIPAGWIEPQDHEDETTRLPAKSRFRWPVARGRKGEEIDLSIVPPKKERSADLAFLGELAEGWYAVTNPKLGVGFGMVWPREVFRHLWLWQEFGGSSGWPWYRSTYVMALEPFTSYDASGLSGCVENGTARKLGPGESVEVELIALLFESETGVERIESDGSVHLRSFGVG